MVEPDHPYLELLHRIELRREKCGGISETQACLKAGQKKDCIRTIRRGNAPRAETLRALAKALDCAPSYFLDAVGIEAGFADDHFETEAHEEDAEVEDGSETDIPGYQLIRTLDERPGMGGPSVGQPDNFGPPELLPERLIRGQLRGTGDDFLLLEVDGPSMSPILESGDKVLIDLRQKNPAQPGIFVVHEGLGYVAKWVQHVPHSDPPRLKITSENSRFDPYEINLDEAKILGRVVWYARKM